MLIEIKTLPRKNPSARGKPPRICILRCDVCDKIYEGDICNKNKDFHRCSMECVYGSRKSDGLGGHGAEVVVLNCDHCGKQLKPQNKNVATKFCNRKCYGRWRADHPEVYEESLKMMQTPEVRKKAIAIREARYASGELVRPQLGRKHTEETKKKISRHHKESGCLLGTKNGMFGRNHTSKAKERMSRKHADLLVNNKQRPYGKNSKKGVYVPKKSAVKDRCNYKSSWELKLMHYLDSSEIVESWEYEPIRIPYYYDSHKRWYVPDFIVKFVDGTQRIYEIKPKEFTKTERSILKQGVAIKYCKENSLSGYQILTGDCLRFINVI